MSNTMDLEPDISALQTPEFAGCTEDMNWQGPERRRVRIYVGGESCYSEDGIPSVLLTFETDEGKAPNSHPEWQGLFSSATISLSCPLAYSVCDDDDVRAEAHYELNMFFSG